jgi:hypothetical protein
MQVTKLTTNRQKIALARENFLCRKKADEKFNPGKKPCNILIINMLQGFISLSIISFLKNYSRKTCIIPLHSFPSGEIKT